MKGECDFRTRGRRRRAGALVTFLVVAAVQAVPTGPAFAAVREFGDMVDYTMEFPVDGPNEFTDTFWAWRSHGTHGSQDLFADKGTPVVAVANGTVRLVNWSNDPGNLNPHRCCSIVIDHDDGWQTAYLHLDNDSPGTDDGAAWGIAPGLVPGAPVAAGQLIGWVGDSGNAEDTPPHLHFELRDADGTKVNSYRALVAAMAQTSGADGPSGSMTGVLERGARGGTVVDLQQSLSTLGLDVGPIDGIFGAMTEAAVLTFQAQSRLEQDGRVGSMTRGAIAGLLRPDGSIIGFGRDGDEVKAIQVGLAAAGFDPGSADGVFGPRTLAAVIGLQKAHALTVDGLVGPQTRGAMEMR